MHVSKRRRLVIGLGVVLAAGAAFTAVPPSAGADGGPGAGHAVAVSQTNLVADLPGLAAITDPALVNAWGMSRGPNTPIWVSDNGADVSTLYRGGVGATPVGKVPLTVAIPGGAPTGQVFNDTTGFLLPGTTSPALFVFAGENGDLSAWNPSAGTQAVAVRHSADAVYKGLALAHSPFGPLLLAADFHHNRIDVYDSSFTLLPVDRLFSDRRLPRGYAPFNVAEIGDKVFVTYARQDAAGHDDVPGRGHGVVDEFTDYGVLVHRFEDRAVLNSPWGLAVAPATFGRLAGSLLVGNFGDGRIHAFDLHSGDFEGTLTGSGHRPLVIDGLWGLLPGDAAAGGTDALWFSAGPDGEAHGLLGVLRAA